jgi:MoaA/NifB/PqqE/SkfB family radical SAM enzyme
MVETIIKHAEIEITHVCGLGCDYCFTPNVHKPDPDELTIEQWKKGIDNLEEIGVKLITFMGGEVTRKKGVEELIEHINKKKKMDYIFLTNGFVSKEVTEKIIESGVRNVGVSIDRVYYKKPEGKKCSTDMKSYQGLKYLMMLKRYGVKILFANCVVSKNNLSEIVEIYNQLSEEGIYLNLTPLQWLKYGGKKFDGVFKEEDRKGINKVMEELIEIKKSSKSTLINSASFLKNVADYSIKQNYKCDSLTMLGFVPDGTLNYCVGQKGELGANKKYNILDVNKKVLNQFLKEWKKDKDGLSCPGCTFSCRDRCGDFNSGNEQYPNLWFNYDKEEFLEVSKMEEKKDKNNQIKTEMDTNGTRRVFAEETKMSKLEISDAEINKIISESYDLHVHIGADILPRKYTVKKLVKEEKGKIRGMVVKTHGFPVTVDEKMMDGKTDDGETIPEIIPSITLNYYTGGFNDSAIYALATVCKNRLFFVWFPTVHAHNHLSQMKGNYEIPPDWLGESKDNTRVLNRIRKKEDIKEIRITNWTGNVLTNKTIAILDEIEKYNNCVLATGHVSWKEARLLVREARKRAIKIIVTHPLQRHIAMPLQVQKELVELGAKIEFCYVVYKDRDHPDDYPISEMARQIKYLGAENCILSSDCGQVHNPSPSECLKEFIKLLTDEGVTKEEIKRMLVHNSKEILEVWAKGQNEKDRVYLPKTG